jgi:hypothetical protein
LPQLRQREAGITLAVPLKHIERLYGWSNIYVDIGLKHYTWSPIFASQYLRPLLRGGIHSKGSSSHAGVLIDEATPKQVQPDAANLYELDGRRFELLSLDPKDCHVVSRQIALESDS